MTLLPGSFHCRGALRVGLRDFRSSTFNQHQCDPDAGEEDQWGSQDHLFRKKGTQMDAGNIATRSASSCVSLKGNRVPSKRKRK